MTSEPSHEDVVRALSAEAETAIAAAQDAAMVRGGVRELAKLLASIRGQRDGSTSILRRAILAEVRDEISARLEVLGASLGGEEQ